MTNTAMYAHGRAADHIDHLYSIINLAKAGAAASETQLKLAHMEGACCSLFEVIHNIASEAVDMAELAANSYAEKPQAPSGPHSPSALYAAWKAAYAQWKAATDALPADASETPEIEALSERTETLCNQLAASRPQSKADCAALLKWVTHEQRQGIQYEGHSTALSSALAFLESKPPMLERVA